MNRLECDVLVAGAGAGGLSAAIASAKEGLDVLVVEKAPVFGGTTAFSGGVLWIPGNPLCPAAQHDTRAAARRYLVHETGAHFDAVHVDAFLEHGPRMVEWFERETCVQFVPTLYPDYHCEAPGGAAVGRSILAKPFDIRALGADMDRLRPPLATITFMGMMFNSSNADLKHFFNVTRSLTSFAYVTKRLVGHLKDLLVYRRAVQVTSGNALAARLAKAAFDARVPIWTSSPVKQLLTNQGVVSGAVVERDGTPMEIHARHGVVLACGGFPHDAERTAMAYPHLRRGGEHVSPVPAANTGDGIRLAESAGAKFEARLAAPAAWMPVSKVPNGNGGYGVFPHLLDRYKPGVIGVNRSGRRFCNESRSYHDVGSAMIEDAQDRSEAAMWLVCDQRALSRYGLGYAKPAPVPVGPYVRSGYLQRGNTIAELARNAGIDAEGLERTVREYNAAAMRGEDPQFDRGRTAFNRYLADPEQHPNPCVAPLVKGPFYALRLYMGDLGTFDGLRTTVEGQVLDAAGRAVQGLYAVGNDRASVMGGNYPGAGITLGPNMTFGWLTGRHIAQAARARKEDRHVA
ncbi:3-oxosteroid 1-dehydrogenase [Variovorax sp. WS11]|uniref:FAD-dependent oxidoreductase n=1 Tax=Variovorax sp. WS11 TaxID=1105204 RepID=UPI000D0DDB6E|nr:FAD-dependent oxidoreductase [Variovorax sp. WS11]NDZ18915.1 FAD-dependent oxidoreductase [Variovorax sp. WS11]PSL82427.1 3-oxosteroid 1-dehydrogenase [Variovorax sp. WS11]